VDRPTSTDQLATLQVIAELGIAQSGDPILTAAARPFRLPAEAGEAEKTLRTLHHAAHRLLDTGSFNNGIGLAAPDASLVRSH
jgi:peptide deformylase